MAVDQEPTYRVRGILTDGFDSTTTCARSSIPCCSGRASARAYACLRWASGYATLPILSPPRLGQPMARVQYWFQDKKAGWYAVLADPRMPVTSTMLDQAHNAIERKLFAMKGFHHPDGNQQAFLTGLAHLYNPVPYQRRAQHAGQCGGGSRRRHSPDTRLVP